MSDEPNVMENHESDSPDPKTGDISHCDSTPHASDNTANPAGSFSVALERAQAAFAGTAEALGITSDEDVQALVNEVRREDSIGN